MKQISVRLLSFLFYIVLLTGIFNASTPEPVTAPLPERLAFYTSHYFGPWLLLLILCEAIYRITRLTRRPKTH